MTAGGEGPGARSRVGRPGPSWPGSGRAHAQTQREETAQPRPPGVREVAGLEVASVWRRALGFLIDSVLLSTAILLFAALAGVDAASPTVGIQVLGLLFRVGYSWVWNTIGWSPGKRVVGLRIVGEEGGPPGVERGFRRSVGALVSDLALGLGYLWALWDPRTQTWHDKMAGTYVVIAPSREDGRTDAGPRRPVG